MPKHKFMLCMVAGLVLALALVACGGGISEKQLYYDVAAAEDRGDLEAQERANGCVRDGLDLEWRSMRRSFDRCMCAIAVRSSPSMGCRKSNEQNYGEGCQRALGYPKA